MRSRFVGLLAVSLILGGVIPLAAHHSFGAEYDFTKPVTLTGAVVKWELINPHGWITLDAKDDEGRVTRWMIETGNPNALIRAGWSVEARRRSDRRGLPRQG